MERKRQIAAAIVPAFNEEKTIGPIVEELKKSDLIDEVVVVCDGSTDQTAAAAKTAGADLVHSLPIKNGKGGAMQHGVTHTDADIIYFCDADLLGFTYQNAERVIRPVLEGKHHMCVGLRDRGRLINTVQKHLPLISGERAMRRSIFENIPDKFLSGFQVEAALNYYCRANRLSYGTVLSQGVHIVRKMQKVGFWRGSLEYVHMFYQIIRSMLIVRLNTKQFKEKFMHWKHRHE